MGINASATCRGATVTGTTLNISNCAKTFPDGTRALLPTNMQVEAGNILCLLGPSGCGKTTLLRIVAGLESPDQNGKIYLDDKDVTSVPIERRNVGMVFQSYALFPNMDVKTNVAYGLKVRGVSSEETSLRVEEVLEICRLTELSHRRISQLSGGQKQRVALARAVAPRPDILLLDEPLSALDAALRESLRDELATMLRSLSITAIFVTHDQNEAMAIADEIAIINKGVVEQTAPPELLYNQPKTEFVASFVGGANELAGKIASNRISMKGGYLAVPTVDHAIKKIYVKPESIELVQPSKSTLKGRVTSKTFLGNHYRLVVTGASDQPLQVIASSKKGPSIGDEVGVNISPELMMLF